MSRLLYEKSVSYKGNLIIPFILSHVGGESIYSYTLLSTQGHKSLFHKIENPAELYSNNLEGITLIAKQHLDSYTDELNNIDYFRERYTYHNNLIIIHQEAGKVFYDHYPPRELRNIAAPRLFLTTYECITWVKQGLDRNRVT